MTDRTRARISDAPRQGWVDDELGLILDPHGCDAQTLDARRRSSGNEKTPSTAGVVVASNSEASKERG
jgi:hypothetical protein